MATIVPIQGGPETAKIRSVFAPGLLGIITFGIYTAVWYFKINREMADLGRKNGRTDLGTSPCTSLFAITIGAIVIVPAIVSLIGTYKRLRLAQQLVGVPEGQQANGWIIFLLCLFGLSIVAYGYMQNELNKVWSAQEHGGVAPVAASGPNFTKA